MEGFAQKMKATEKKVADFLMALKPTDFPANKDWTKDAEYQRVKVLADLARDLAADSKVQVGDLKVSDAHTVSEFRRTYEEAYKISEEEYQAIYKGNPSLQKMEQASFEGLLKSAGNVVVTKTRKKHKHTVIGADGNPTEETKEAKMYKQTIGILIDGQAVPLELSHVGFDEETLAQVNWTLDPFQKAEQQQRVKLITEMRLVDITPAEGVPYHRWIGKLYRIVSRIGASNLVDLPEVAAETGSVGSAQSQTSYEDME